MIGFGISPVSMMSAFKDFANFSNDRDDFGFMRGVAFSLNCTADYYSDSGDAHAFEAVHVVILGRQYAFVHRAPSQLNLLNTKMEDWMNTGNHNSEWRSALDTALLGIYFDLCTLVRNQLPELKLAPVDITTSVTMGWSNPLCIVAGRMKNVDDSNSYWKTLTDLHILKSEVTITKD